MSATTDDDRDPDALHPDDSEPTTATTPEPEPKKANGHDPQIEIDRLAALPELDYDLIDETTKAAKAKALGLKNAAALDRAVARVRKAAKEKAEASEAEAKKAAAKAAKEKEQADKRAEAEAERGRNKAAREQERTDKKAAKDREAAEAEAAKPTPASEAEIAAAVADLAKLTKSAYELIRHARAKALGFTRTPALDELVAAARAAEVKARPATVSVNNPLGLPDLYIESADLPMVSQQLRDLLAERHQWTFERGGPARLVTFPPAEARHVEVHLLKVEGTIHAAHEVCRPFQIRIDGTRIDVTLPEDVAKLYLALHSRWQLRPLHGICGSVLLDHDGSIHSHEGYHAPTGMWCTKAPPLTVPHRPTRNEAVAALQRLRLRQRTFTLKNAPLIEHDGNLVVDVQKNAGLYETAALCGLLTGVTRASLPLAPGIMINAPALSGSGAGKGLLARAITAIAFGSVPKASTAGHDEAELEKRIGAILMRGEPVILLDNLNNTLLRSPQLESCLTEPLVSVRVFGKLEMQDIRTTALILLTGNGLQASGDAARRWLYPTIEPPVENPERRKYPPGFLDDILAHRSELLSDCLTIWRWGRQQPSLKRGLPWGTFERWAEWVRDPLLALGCSDPAEAVSEVRASDPARLNIAALFAEWRIYHQDKPVKADDLDFHVRRLIDDKDRPNFVRQRLGELRGTRLGGYQLTGTSAGKGKHLTWTYQVIETNDPDGNNS